MIDRRPILLFGAGAFAAEVFDMATTCGARSVAGCVVDMDTTPDLRGLPELPIYRLDEVASRHADHVALNAIGSPARRRFIERAERLGFRFLTLVHPTAQIAPSATIGEGSVIGAGCVVAARASIGRHALLNRGVLLGHHGELGAFVTCGPGVNIGGLARIDAESAIGIGAVVVDRVAIGARCTVAAGAIVTKSFGDDVTIAGSPARVAPPAVP